MSYKKCNMGFWLEFFKHKSQKRDRINWHEKENISAEEKIYIENSVGQFQLGEYSEGKNLLRFAKLYGVKIDDSRISEVTKYFIQEEQHHAFLLGKFMDRYGMKKQKSHWTDSIFRSLRKCAGFDFSLTILTSAEIASFPFYTALKRVTTSKILQDICDQLQCDETFHLRYESELLHQIRSERNIFYNIKYTIHELILFVVSLFVWYNHKEILTKGGYELTSFIKTIRDIFKQDIIMSKVSNEKVLGY